jgi:hypothetical protein
LKELIRKWNQGKVEEYLRQKDFVRKLNPPAALHMGGARERIIRSIKEVRDGLVIIYRIRAELRSRVQSGHIENSKFIVGR